ncbi:MAG: hypothetical protein ACT4N4_01925 [Rhodospirillales bacterium]
MAAVLAVALDVCGPAWPAFAAELVQAERVFDLRIEGDKLARGERVVRVKQGDAVRLRWTTTAPVDLHLHGYEIELHVEPGAVAELAFKAHATGRFPIQIHGARAPGGGHRHGPPLVQIEVHPR